MRILAQKTGCCVIGVNYTLAPEKKFPTQILESVTAIRYFMNTVQSLALIRMISLWRAIPAEPPSALPRCSICG